MPKDADDHRLLRADHCRRFRVALALAAPLWRACLAMAEKLLNRSSR